MTKPSTDLSAILSLPSLSHHSPTSTAPLLTRTTHFIQTLPSHHPSASLTTQLHVLRPVDFFPGRTRNLKAEELLVRTETQTFFRLEKSGAVVMSSRARVERLMDLEEVERRELWEEVRGWGVEEARVKGREIWGRVLEALSNGK